MQYSSCNGSQEGVGVRVDADTEGSVLIEMGVGIRSGMPVAGIKFAAGSGDITAASLGSRSDAVEQLPMNINRGSKNSRFKFASPFPSLGQKEVVFWIRFFV